MVYYQEFNKYVVHTDACLEGAGMFCGGDWAYVNWSQDDTIHRSLHINYKEVLAVLWAARRWGHRWTDAHVTVVMDSMVGKLTLTKVHAELPWSCRFFEKYFGCL